MKKTYNAFTLIELIVLMWIIMILGVIITSLDFNRISQDEIINTESIKILASLEEMRNNALIWRAEDIDWTIPQSWNISFNKDDDTYTTSITKSDNITEAIKTNTLRSPFEIINISCQNLDGSSSEDADDVEILFSIWWSTKLSGCDENNKIVEIELWIWDTTQIIIKINTLTNVIEQI